jgi:hypothetical protein
VAESIILHFCGPRQSDAEQAMEKLGTRLRPYAGEWCFAYPPASEEGGHAVLVYAYPDILEEYEPENLKQLIVELGGVPTASVAVELRRSRGAEAADAAAAVVRELLRRLGGIVDDTYSQFWHLAEIEAGVSKQDGRFLDCYKYT